LMPGAPGTATLGQSSVPPINSLYGVANSTAASGR
jgi:hypothetical protein